MLMLPWNYYFLSCPSAHWWKYRIEAVVISQTTLDSIYWLVGDKLNKEILTEGLEIGSPIFGLKALLNELMKIRFYLRCL